ncbi:MAG: FkbM family methyltransferase, partial [Tepidisphaeraceae bacterium]
LKPLGIDEGGYSQRWARLGLRPMRLRSTPYWLVLDPGNWGQRMTYLRGEYYERHVNLLLRRLLSPGDAFVDIGANIGVHTLLGAALVGPGGVVVAVEPNPTTFAALQGHLAVNRVRHATAHAVALGDAAGTVAISNCSGENLGSHARPDAASHPSMRSVRVERGDDLLAHIPIDRAGVCKIDTEGYELRVLAGMTRFVESHPRMHYCVEVTDKWLRATGGSAEELFHFFATRNFIPFAIERGGVRRAISKPLDDWQYDALFVHLSQADRL